MEVFTFLIGFPSNSKGPKAALWDSEHPSSIREVPIMQSCFIFLSFYSTQAISPLLSWSIFGAGQCWFPMGSQSIPSTRGPTPRRHPAGPEPQV